MVLPFPRRLLLMAEYGIELPLWDRSRTRDASFDRLRRRDLELSAELESRLAAWNQQFDMLAATDFAWPSAEANLAFVVAGHALAAELQRELGGAVLVLYPESDNGAPAECTALSDQIRSMPDAEFDAVAGTADLAQQHVWIEGHTSTRVLLEPRDGDLPLADRSPLVGRTSDVVAASALGLTEEITQRLIEWSRRWGESPLADDSVVLDDWQLQYLAEGRVLAADVQYELGLATRVHFPEADIGRSQPEPEMQAFIDRLQARRRAT